MKTILLFDWTSGGHHACYVRRFAEALAPHFRVVAAVPDPVAGEIRNAPLDVHSLGAPRPILDTGRPLPPQHRELALAEIALMRTAVSSVAPDQLLHLYADPVIRRLVQQPALGVPTTICLFFPRAHYPSAFGAPLVAKERLRALFLEYLVARWRRRADAHGVLTLDDEAARRWIRRNGAPAYWLPEPPVAGLPRASNTAERRGCVLYGVLAARKGVDVLAAAMVREPIDVPIVIAGAVETGYERTLAGHVSAMQRAGADVDLRARPHRESEALELMAGARCVVLPYIRTFGMSRTLLEAATVGTPVVAHHHGLVGHLVRTHELGLAVDCADPSVLREAMLRLSGDPHACQRYARALARFSAAYSPLRFQGALLECLGAGERATHRPEVGVVAS
jgi:glycosyltransferase involved in cell wall biosynthesis